MPTNPYVKLLIAGALTQDFIIDLDGKAANNLPGGSLFYAAAGARIWQENIGLIGRVGSNYPEAWLKSAEKRGLDTSGILRLAQPYEVRHFFHWQDGERSLQENPVASYARVGLSFPHELLGYHPQTTTVPEKMWANISANLNPTFPNEYMDISGAHICPLDLMAHIKLPAVLQKGLVNTITISPSDDYMLPAYFQQIPAVIKDTFAFLPTEAQISSLFRGRSQDLWEMAAGLTEMGCPIILIYRGEKGFCMFDAASHKKYVLPFYPTRWQDPTGIFDVFAGAFLGEYKTTYDPLQALIAGAAVASLAVEGTGAFYCLDRLPGLETARCEVLKTMVTAI